MAVTHRQVLVLNKAWMAINIVSLESAMNKLTGTHRNGQPKAEVLDCVYGTGTMAWDDWRQIAPHPYYCSDCCKILPTNEIVDGVCVQCENEVGEKGIRGVNNVFRMPTIIVLTRYDKPAKQKVKYNRRTIYRRDNNTCFVGDTLVMMADFSLKAISDVVVGDGVLDAYGNSQVVEYVHIRQSEPGEMLSIKHRCNGDPLLCTGDHKILGFAWNGDAVGGEEGIPADRLSASSMIAEIVPPMPDESGEFDLFEFAMGHLPYVKLEEGKVKHYCGLPQNRYLKLDNALGRLCGYYLAEGSVVNTTVNFSLNGVTEKAYAEEISALLKSIFGLESVWEVNGNKGNVICHSSLLSLFFSENFGKKDAKHVGMKPNRAFLEGILYGVCRGDAAFNSDQSRCTVMMSRPMLIRDLYVVSLMLGLCPSLSKTGIRTDGRIYKSLNFNAADFNAVASLSVVPYIEWQRSKAGKIDRNRVGNRLISKITEIKRVEYDGLVYDLQVSGSHIYIANFVCVHNCQYCGCKPGMKELSLDHVAPRCQGGKTTWENVVVACTPCNAKKAGRTPKEAGMKLLKEPKRPIHNVCPSNYRVKDWDNFLS